MAKAVEKVNDDVSMMLLAPEGWKKTLLPKKRGTPRRNEIVFVSPTGEEIKSKRQLDQYLKSHPGGPSSSEFEWSTGETPRRSRRIIEKSKATETPESETPRKRQNISSSKKGLKDHRDDSDEEGEAIEEKQDTVVGEETKTVEVEMKEADDLGNKSKEEVSTEDAAIPVSDKDLEPKPEEKDVEKDEIDIEKCEHQGTDTETTSNPNEAHMDINLLSTPSLDANEEGQKQTKEPEALQKVGNEGLEGDKEGEKQLKEPETPSKVGNKGLEGDEEGVEKQTEECADLSKVGNNKADEITISDDSKKKVGSISQAASGPGNGGEGGAEKHSIEPESPSSLSVHEEAVSTEKEVKTLKEALPEADANLKKESDNKEVSTGKSLSVGETKVINDILKEGQDGSTPLDNHSNRSGGDIVP